MTMQRNYKRTKGNFEVILKNLKSFALADEFHFLMDDHSSH